MPRWPRPGFFVIRYLYGFEEYCRSACITFRTIHHNNPRPPTTPGMQRTARTELKEFSPPLLKAEPVDDKGEEAGSESEKEELKERHSSPRVSHSDDMRPY